MKRIAVLSDTHIPIAAPDIPERIYSELRRVDMILHAGDLIEIDVLEKLRSIAPTHAVHGNMDMYEVKMSLPKKDIITINSFKIGLIHGTGCAANIIENVAREFDDRIDVIVFGHSHCPCNEKIKKTLFFNPGSPTDKMFALCNTFGLLEIEDGISSTIMRL